MSATKLRGYALVHTVAVEHQHSVSLYQGQRSTSAFAVVYGAHIVKSLSYTAAAHEFGECMMHALACNGDIDGYINDN